MSTTMFDTPIGSRQHETPEGVLDLGAGQPDLALLPVEHLARAARAWRELGPAALEYGANAGPKPLRSWLAARLGCDESELLVTAGASHALQLIASAVGGGVAVAERHTYQLGVNVLRSERVLVHEAAQDEEGMSADGLDRALGTLKAGGTSANLVYLQAAHQNPTSASMSQTRLEAVLAVAREHDVLVLIDDAYRELSFATRLASMAACPGVVHVGTFAKTIGPGIRVGWIQADANLIAQLEAHPLLVSGGGIAHLASLAVARFCVDGEYDRHLVRVRSAYAARARTLRAALVEAGLPAAPAATGGFFVWQPLPAALPTPEIESALLAAGLIATPSERFAVAPSGDSTHVRLAFSRQPDELMAEAAQRLAAAVGATRPAR